MTSPQDIIEIPGYPGWFNRRVAVERWQQAGSPAIVDAGRLYGKQKLLYDNWVSGVPGYNPADNPDDLWRALGHCRFVAFDIKYKKDRQAMLDAGFDWPFSWEWWHFAEHGVHDYDIVKVLPERIPEKKVTPDMPIFIEPNVIVWPNGYSNSYDRNVYLACQWAANGDLNYLNGGGWAAEILVSESWKATYELDRITDGNNKEIAVTQLSQQEIADKVKAVLEEREVHI